jgi:hypothetical protein
MPSNAFNVYLGSKLIDTVFDSEKDPAEVKRSLINHDGYDNDIRVVKVRKATPKKQLAPSQQEHEQVGPVPPYDHKTDGDYSAWLVFNNID